MKVHVDTDFAGDTDDACALGLVLGAADVELIGATTVADPDGMRAGYLDHFLRTAGRTAPIAAGAGASLTTGEAMGGLPDHAAFWGSAAVKPLPAPDGAAIELLEGSVEAGASIVAIGPHTNLARLAAARPGLLDGAHVVMMGGWIAPPRAGLPQWGPGMDWNVQCDPDATQAVFGAAGDLTLATLAATLDACVRESDVARLGSTAPVGELLARQLNAHASAHDMGALGRAHADLPDDLLNFQYDVAACAVAIGLPVAELAELVLAPRLDERTLRFEETPAGRSVLVTNSIDREALNALWLDAIERVDSAIVR